MAANIFDNTKIISLEYSRPMKPHNHNKLKDLSTLTKLYNCMKRSKIK